MMKTLLRGAFINTEAALCSIYESGRQVFDCITAPDVYDLDYFELGDIDIEALRQSGMFRLKADAKSEHQPAGAYDFWVLNHHHTTMAPDLPSDLVEKLNGPTFAIVLEVEPQNPLAMAARTGFDGFIVLDPSAQATREVFPFPRPLIAGVQRPRTLRNKVPVIGSFGMGTPGKGFDLVVEAVNREFDEAVVRINVPPATYADERMYRVHGEPYALHLKKICERIAKPGVTIEFTRVFMEDSELLAWCGANDLNLFLYSRRQSGLSATTDQAVASGRPLLVSSNDTFRHIHPYIQPYPLTSLRQAIKSGAPAVALMQKAWSRDAFRLRFLTMLTDFGVIGDLGDTSKPIRKTQVAKKRLLFASGPQASNMATDQRAYSVRVADAMGRTGKYDVASMLLENSETLDAAIMWHTPDAVILSDGNAVRQTASVSLDETGGQNLVVSLGSSCAIQDEGSSADSTLSFPRRPLVPYFTSVADPAPGPPQFCLVGFSQDSSNLEMVLAKIHREIAGGVVNVVCQEADRLRLERRLAAFAYQIRFTPAVEFRVISLPDSASGCIHLFGTQRIIIFGNNEEAEEELLSLAELALTTERAVVFTEASRFSAFIGLEPLLEDQWLPDLLTYGSAVQAALVSEFGEGRFIASLGGLLDDALLVRPTGPEGGLPWCRSGQVPLLNGIITDEHAAWLKAAAGINSERPAVEASYVGAQQGFLALSMLRWIPMRPGTKVAVFGNPEKSGAAALAQAGYELVRPEASEQIGYASGAIGTVALSALQDAKIVLTAAIAALRDDGLGAFTFFYRDDFAIGDPGENSDFPVMTRGDLELLVEDLPIELIGPAAWRSWMPSLVPQPFSPPPLGTLMFRKTPSRTTEHRK